MTQSDATPRRQRGTDGHQNPLPPVPAVASETTVALGRMAVVVTFVAWVAFVVTVLLHRVAEPAEQRPGLPQTVVYISLVSALAASSLAYLVARLGFFARAKAHRRVARASIDAQLAEHAPSLTVLVPSYQEDPRVVRLTLLTAALHEYPELRLVLLIDDPPEPTHAEPHRMLQGARALPGEIDALLAEPAAYFRAAGERFAVAATADRNAGADELEALAGLYADAARWLDRLVAGYVVTDHAEQFVCDHVLGRLSADLSVSAAALRSAATARFHRVSTARLDQLARRLVWIFSVDVTSFERKQYASLSHEPNKAMNLNAYIGLMGGRYREVASPRGTTLVAVGPGEPADLVVPDPDLVLTLDADSVLLPEYCLRLAHLLEQEHNARVAVAQTPYSAYPGAATRVERIAGATTDIQHIVHQGMTQHGASFWVGANAILRKRALDEIVETEHVGEWPVHRYIKDRTVIEDTESSVDLAIHDWDVFNYPERLSYSATPPDFGSLCIQRGRWANGGLLVAPKLMTHVRRRRARGQRTGFSELFLRVNYLMSICWTSISLPLLLVYGFNGELLSPLVLVMAAPYFLAMSYDLRACGYRRLDVLRVYAFNLLLLAVNVAGWASSVAQSLTGSKGQFRRTPKVQERTVPALTFVVFPYALIILSLLTLRHDWALGHWNNAAFAGGNALLGLYGVVAFIGLRHSIGDVWVSVRSWLHAPDTGRPDVARRPARPAAVAPATQVANWQDILYFGGADAGAATPPRTVTPAPDPPARHEEAPRATTVEDASPVAI